jgi:formamidopyrimidine-DNA glycosylase
MPELPEVETIAVGLAPRLVGRLVRRVFVHERRLRVPLAAGFPRGLEGRRLCGLRRVGKSLVATLDDDRRWIVHLGMTGRFTLRAAAAARRPHDHVVVLLDGDEALVFNDVRRFGRMAVVESARLAAAVGRGVDPLAPEFPAEFLFGTSRARRLTVKSLLMDQRLIVGLGNIYVNEALFHAGVRPRRRAGRLTRRDSERIVAATREVLAHAIACGGSSISDYRDGFDGFGTYQEHHHVYDRTGDPCRCCGVPIRGCVITGRSSFFCPRCQR